MYNETPPSVLRPNQGGIMIRGGKTTVIKPGMPTAGASSARPMAAPPVAARAAAPAGRTVLPRPASPAAARPNQGGTITTPVTPNLKATVLKPATPPANTAPNRPNAGGTMVRGGVTTIVPPGQPTAGASTAAPAPVAAAPMAPPPQVPDSAAPSPAAPPAAVAPPPAPPAGEALGFSSRGSMAPTGTDAQPGDANVGGTGLYSKRFSSPASAKIYDNYVKRIFGSAQPNKAPNAGVIPSPQSAAEPKPTVEE